MLRNLGNRAGVVSINTAYEYSSSAHFRSAITLSLSYHNYGSTRRQTSMMRNAQDYSIVITGDSSTLLDRLSLSERQPLVDIRTLSLEERKRLAQGPKISIHEHGIFLLAIPENLLLATSQKWQNRIASCPVPIDSINILSVKAYSLLYSVLKWLLRNTRSEAFKPLPVFEDLESNLQLCRAARLIGLEDYYVEHIIQKYAVYGQQEMPRFLFISMAESYALDQEDPFLRMAAKQLCRLRRYRNGIPDESTFEAWLKDHDLVRLVMAVIDEEMAKERRMRAQIRGRRYLGADELSDEETDNDGNEHLNKKV